jgi:hypothetical protein
MGKDLTIQFGSGFSREGCRSEMSSLAIKTVALGKRYRSHFGFSRPPTLDGLDLNIREG